jgi:hypothetical protein
VTSRSLVERGVVQGVEGVVVGQVVGDHRRVGVVWCRRVREVSGGRAGRALAAARSRSPERGRRRRRRAGQVVGDAAETRDGHGRRVVRGRSALAAAERQEVVHGAALPLRFGERQRYVDEGRMVVGRARATPNPSARAQPHALVFCVDVRADVLGLWRLCV